MPAGQWQTYLDAKSRGIYPKPKQQQLAEAKKQKPNADALHMPDAHKNVLQHEQTKPDMFVKRLQLRSFLIKPAPLERGLQCFHTEHLRVHLKGSPIGPISESHVNLK